MRLLQNTQNNNQKHAMQQTITSMKDVLQEIDDNPYEDTESDSNDIITPQDDEKND